MSENMSVCERQRGESKSWQKIASDSNQTHARAVTALRFDVDTSRYLIAR